jgi:heme exporter protein D
MTAPSTWVGIIIAVGSLIVAIVALVVSSRTQKKLVQIEEQREADRLEKSKAAELSAEIRPTSRGSDRLFITNSGECEARNVEVRIGNKPLAEHPAAVKGEEIPKLIGPGSSVSCLLAFSFGCGPPFELEITWDDDSGKGKHYRTTLTW